MVAFLFIVLLSACLYLVFDFKNKSLQQRRQILLLKKQNSNLKVKAEDKSSQLGKLTVKYYEPQNDAGRIIENCTLRISPLDFSHVLASIPQDTIVQIRDCAEVSGAVWYEVVTDSEEGINNKGWVRGTYITFGA